MRILTIILLQIIWSIPMFCQERQVNLEAQFVTSKGIGDGSGGGIKVELVLPLNDFFSAVAESSVLSEPKGYVGNNIGIRTRVEGRVFPLGVGTGRVRPYFSAGFSNTYQRNSDYTKSINGWTAGGGINIADFLVPFYRHYELRPDYFQTGIRSNELGVNAYITLDPRSKWRIKSSLAATRASFVQTAGVGAGSYSYWSIVGGLGIGRKF